MDTSPDYDFGNNKGIDLGFRSLSDQLDTDTVRPIATSFVANINRLHCLWALPVEAANWGCVLELVLRMVSDRSELYKLAPKPALDILTTFLGLGLDFSALASDKRSDVVGAVKSFYDFTKSQFPAEQAAVMTGSIWERGNSVLEGIASASPPNDISEGLQATLSSIVIGAWTAFEILAVDLWVAAINEGSHDWARKVFSAKGTLTPDDPKNPDLQERSITLSKIADYGFDLRKKMGKLLKDTKKVNFESLNNTRKAYEVVFGEDVKKLFELPEHEEIAVVEAVRNLLAHRGGIVDKKFLDRIERFPRFKDVKVGDKLTINGPLATALLSCSSKLGSELLRFIDMKLHHHFIILQVVPGHD